MNNTVNTMVNTLTPLVNHHVSQQFFLAPRWRCGYRPIVAGPVFALLKPCWLMISSSFQRGFRHHTVDIHVDTTHKWWLMRFDIFWICVVVLSNIKGLRPLPPTPGHWVSCLPLRRKHIGQKLQLTGWDRFGSVRFRFPGTGSRFGSVRFLGI